MSCNFVSFIHSLGNRLATIPCRRRIMKNWQQIFRLFFASERNLHNEIDYENIVVHSARLIVVLVTRASDAHVRRKTCFLHREGISVSIRQLSIVSPLETTHFASSLKFVRRLRNLARFVRIRLQTRSVLKRRCGSQNCIQTTVDALITKPRYTAASFSTSPSLIRFGFEWGTESGGVMYAWTEPIAVVVNAFTCSKQARALIHISIHLTKYSNSYAGAAGAAACRKALRSFSFHIKISRAQQRVYKSEAIVWKNFSFRWWLQCSVSTQMNCKKFVEQNLNSWRGIISPECNKSELIETILKFQTFT